MAAGNKAAGRMAARLLSLGHRSSSRWRRGSSPGSSRSILADTPSLSSRLQVPQMSMSSGLCQGLSLRCLKAEFTSKIQKHNFRRVPRHHEICIENDVFMKEIIGNPVQDWKRTIQKQNWAAANGDNKREESEHVVFMKEIIGTPTA